MKPGMAHVLDGSGADASGPCGSIGLGAMSSADLIRDAQAHVEGRIEALFDRKLALPGDARDQLFAAMRHAAMGGGKRLRPLLVWAATRPFSDHVDERAAITVGGAVEAIHVYSLVHDDLPAMDDDDLRRGKPTVHRAYDEATAILAGDAFQALAFDLLTDETAPISAEARCALVAALARAAGADGMVGGQVLDIAAEGRTLDQDEIARLQALKTGALFGFSLEAGAILGGAGAAQTEAYRRYAQAMGLAFQIADDILDVTGDAALAGKALGKDEAAGKATYVSLLGLDAARAEARRLSDAAISALDGFDDRADLLRAVARYSVERDR